MSKKGLKKMMVMALLLMVIIGQSGLTFAAITPTFAISTPKLVYTLTEDGRVDFSVIASDKIALDVVWNPIKSDDLLLSQTGTLKTSKTVKRVTTYYEEAKYTFAPQNIDVETTYKYTISATSKTNASYSKEITMTFVVSPVIVPDYSQSFVYVALGDSIPSGVSYEGSLTAKNIESYSDKLAIQYANANANNPFEYFDYAVSGYNAIDVFNQVNNPAYQNAISQADVITLCVGANDIMDAAKRNWTGSINFYSISWAKADAGRIAFEYYWPRIIQKIQTLNSDVDLMVATIYNPYNQNDSKTYNKVAGQDTSLLIHGQVDLYLWNDTPSKLGLNTIISNYKLYNPLTINYIVVDVHKYFDSFYGNSKGSVTGFYGNWVQDPHPDPNGQTVIYNLHK